jgi:hypothetical protein
VKQVGEEVGVLTGGEHGHTLAREFEASWNTEIHALASDLEAPSRTPRAELERHGGDPEGAQDALPEGTSRAKRPTAGSASIARLGVTNREPRHPAACAPPCAARGAM